MNIFIRKQWKLPMKLLEGIQKLAKPVGVICIRKGSFIWLSFHIVGFNFRCQCKNGQVSSNGKTCTFNNYLYLTYNTSLALYYPGSVLHTIVNESHYVVSSTHDFNGETLIYATWNRGKVTTLYKYFMRSMTKKLLYSCTYWIFLIIFLQWINVNVNVLV